jgi:hypothetical protein
VEQTWSGLLASKMQQISAFGYFNWRVGIDWMGRSRSF